MEPVKIGDLIMFNRDWSFYSERGKCGQVFLVTEIDTTRRLGYHFRLGNMKLNGLYFVVDDNLFTNITQLIKEE